MRDPRVFLIKDGIVQPGFELGLYYAEYTYDESIRMALVHATHKNVLPTIYFNVDLRGGSKVCKLTKNAQDHIGTWNKNLRSLVVAENDNFIKNTSSSHGTYVNISDGDVCDLTTMNTTDSMYIFLIPYATYSTNASTTYDYYVKDLWVEYGIPIDSIDPY